MHVSTIASQMLKTPIGMLRIVADSRSILHIDLSKKSTQKGNAITAQCAQELHEYFSRNRTSFSVHIAPEGTPFQRSVWKVMRNIGCGKTISYRELAQAIGKPKAARAVGSACGKNPILILIPCHRVLASQGKLGGFSAGLTRKKFLLAHEKKAKR